MRKLSTLLLFSILLFSSCKEDENHVRELSPDDSETLLNEMSSQMAMDFDEITRSEGYKQISQALSFLGGNDIDISFSSLKDLFKTPATKNHLQQFSKELSEILKANPLQRAKDEDFSFLWGVYEYNSATQNFELSQKEDVDYIQLVFPADNSETNNASLTITELSLYTYFSGDTESFEYFQTVDALQASLKVDQQLISSIDLVVDFTQDQLTSIQLELFVLPYTLTISSQSSGHILNSSLYLTNDNENLLSYNLSSQFSEPLDNINTELVSVSGQLNYRSFSLQGTINAMDLQNNSTDLNAEIINEAIQLSLHYSADKLGDLNFQFNDENDLLVYLVFSDGSRLLLNSFISDFLFNN